MGCPSSNSNSQSAQKRRATAVFQIQILEDTEEHGHTRTYFFACDRYVASDPCSSVYVRVQIGLVLALFA